MSAIWAVALVDGEAGKDIYVGREDGSLQRYAAKAFSMHPTGPATLTLANVHSGAITGISAASADEVTTCSVDGTVRTFNTAAEVEGKREQKTVEVGTSLRCMLVAGEQTFLGGHDGAVHVLAGPEQTPQQWTGHKDWVVSLSSNETNLFSASYDQTVRVWDLASGKTTFILRGHTNQVKFVQTVSNFLFSGSRDNNLLVWTLPEAGEGAGEAEGGAAAAAPAAAEGEEGAPAAEDEDVPLAVDTTQGPIDPESLIPKIGPAAIIELPSTPHDATVSGTSNLFVGFADHKVRCINTRDLTKSVQNFLSETKATYKKCKKHLDRNASISIKNLKTVHKKSLKAKKQELLNAAAEAAKAAAAAARAARQATTGGGEDDEEAEAEPEPVDMGADEEQETTLSEEQQQQLKEYTDALTAELNRAIGDVQSAKATKVNSLGPISKQSFLCAKDKFDRVSFTRTYDTHSPHAVVSLAMDGVTAYAATGAEVTPVQCRPGVTVL